MLNVMKLVLTITLFVFYIWLTPSLAKQSIRYPEYENMYVNDYANILDAELEGLLKQRLQHAGINNGPQITLLTIQSLGAYGHTGLEAFATGLFNHWGVGSSERNDGVLILVSTHDRKMRIELGSGYSYYYDQIMKDVIEGAFIPYFKQDDYPAGIKIGIDETIYQITGQYSGNMANRFFDKVKVNVFYWVDKLGGWIFAIIVPIFMFVFSKFRKMWRLRPRSCGACQHKMTMLDEQTDDDHIDGGQRMEEFLESVDYDVWRCGSCQRIDIYRYKNFFRSHEACRKCDYFTLAADTTIIERATTSSKGLKRIDYHCQNCNFRDTETRTIPRKSESSSSSGGSSGGSSFGGGSSSGGGASGSW